LQQWFNLSDRSAEEAIYDSVSMRRFLRIDLSRSSVPDETTICKFRHLLEKHDLGAELFKAANRHLRKRGVKVTTGTIVDASNRFGAEFDEERAQGARS
jgi:IS5 family transposase